ncbi:MAG: hypothetical protein BWY82_00729 [Verrucomicrobia bacterium ADurb.Bin474]|nr:MAG: hypothetical protein BWY82_00729 [Verrucomicrobia bacterium ADurb.Bin474]
MGLAIHCTKHEFTNVVDLPGQGTASLPVDVSEFFPVEVKRTLTLEAHEIKFGSREDPFLDRIRIGFEFGLCQMGKKTIPGSRIHLTSVLDRCQCPSRSCEKPLEKTFFVVPEYIKKDLPLVYLVAESRRDAASGGTSGFLFQDMRPIVFPCEIEESMAQIADLGALVDAQSRKNGIPECFDRLHLPPDLARIGHDPGTHREMFNPGIHNSAGQEIVFQSSGGVSGIGSAIYLQHHCDVV